MAGSASTGLAWTGRSQDWQEWLDPDMFGKERIVLERQHWRSLDRRGTGARSVERQHWIGSVLLGKERPGWGQPG